jgi:glycosyltransferase involved in cell wall biosynthesis
VVDKLRYRAVPYVITLHDGWWVSPNQFVVSPEGVPETYRFDAVDKPVPDRARITRRALESAAAVLAVSESFADLHRTAGIDGVETVENGVSALAERRFVPGPSGRVRLGLIGGASRHKGYALLRAAIHARQFQNIDLVVVDHALPRGQVRQEIWNTTPVAMVPRVSMQDVGALYGVIDVLLAPSVWPESHGLVTREALALGLWVVASDRGAIGQHVVEGENGFVVDVSDHHALVTCLAKIDADPDRFSTPPATRPDLRPAQAQAEALHKIYHRVLNLKSEQEI